MQQKVASNLMRHKKKKSRRNGSEPQQGVGFRFYERYCIIHHI